MNLTLGFPDRQAFVHRLISYLSGIGYVLQAEAGGSLNFKFAKAAVAFPITAHIGDRQATIIGPKWHVNKVRKAFRF